MNLELEQLGALLDAQRLESSLLQARIERLTSVIEEHGLKLPPDDPRLGASDGEHLLQSRRVVVAAYRLLAELEALRDMVGSGTELLEPTWRE